MSIDVNNTIINFAQNQFNFNLKFVTGEHSVQLQDVLEYKINDVESKKLNMS